MSIKAFRVITGMGTALIVSLLLVACNNTPNAVSPSPTPTMDDSLVPTKATDIPPWNGASIIGIPTGTQGRVFNMTIGLSGTRASEYLNNGVKQYRMTAVIHLSKSDEYGRDGPIQALNIALSQTFEMYGYSFFVTEIRPTHYKSGDPPGASGGGMVELLCIPTTDISKATSPSTDTTQVTWSWIPTPGNKIDDTTIAYFPEGGAYVQSGKTLNLVWLADNNVEAYVLAENQFVEVRDTGTVTASLVYGSGKVGSINWTVKESAKYYAVVKASSESGSSVILYSAILGTKIPAPGSTSTSGNTPNVPPEDLTNTKPPTITVSPNTSKNPPPPLQAPVFTVPLPRTDCNVQLPVLGGVPPYSWSVWSGQMPDGYQLDSSGYITGTLPSTPSTARQMSLSGVQMKVQDSAGTIVMVQHAGGVSNDNSFFYGFVRPHYYNPAVQPGIKQNPAVAYTDSVFHFSPFVTGGVRPLTFFANGLPQGLTCDSSTGIIEGTPARSAAGQIYSVLVYGKDAAGHTMAGAENAGVYITVVDRSPTTTTTTSGAIPNIIGAWHGTLEGSGTFTMNINEQYGSSFTGTMDVTFPGLVLTGMNITNGKIESYGPVPSLGFSAAKGSFTFRFDGAVKGNAVSGTYSGGATGYSYSGTWNGTRP